MKKEIKIDMQHLKVSKWRNGSSKNACYGIRISLTNYVTIKDWEEIKAGVDSIKKGNRKLTEKCPEIRDTKFFKTFFEDHHLTENWKDRTSYELFLSEYEKNRYILNIEKANLI